MKSLTIRFINEPGIVSKLITWQTDSLFCHTEALGRDGKSWVGAHAVTGVEARANDWCQPTFERRYELPVTDEQYEAAMLWLESKIGMPYNYLDIVGLTIRRRIGATDHEFTCSAFMYEFMWSAFLVPLNVLPEYGFLCTPETLHLSPLFIGHCVYHFSK